MVSIAHTHPLNLIQVKRKCQRNLKIIFTIHTTFLNLKVKCLKDCLVSMTIKPFSGSRIPTPILTLNLPQSPYPNLKILVSLHYLVLPQNDRRHLFLKGSADFYETYCIPTSMNMLNSQCAKQRTCFGRSGPNIPFFFLCL